MVEKLFLSEKDYEYLAKSIILGVVIGIFIGIAIDNIVLAFSACTAMGIFFSFLYSLYKKFKNL